LCECQESKNKIIMPRKDRDNDQAEPIQQSGHLCDVCGYWFRDPSGLSRHEGTALHRARVLGQPVPPNSRRGLATRRIREGRESSLSTPAELHVRAAARTTEIALDDGATGTAAPTTTTAVGSTSTTAAGSHRTAAPRSTTQAGNEITVDETAITSDRMGEWSEISDWLDEYLSEVPSGSELATFAPLTGAAETQRPVETEPRDPEPCGGGRLEESGGAVRRSDSLWSRRFQRESDD